jgi:hypothetical protein
VFNNSIAFDAIVVFPPLRVTGRGDLVCNKKEELNLPGTYAGALSVSCDVNHVFHQDEIRCHYGSYPATAWIIGVGFSALVVGLFVCVLVGTCLVQLGTYLSRLPTAKPMSAV